MRYLTLALAATLLLALDASAETYLVRPDGTGDFPTIQQAIDAIVDGDIIELTDGTFTGPGNRDLDYNGKAITVRSQNGNPQACIIDCEGTEFQCHRGVYFHSGEGPASVLEGVTIARGYVSGPGGTPEDWGGAVLILDSSPTLTNCIFFGNQARDSGGGILCWDSSPTIAGCTFSRNMAQWGGGMQCLNCFTTFTDCTFYGNFGSANGGGLYDCLESSSSLTNVTFSNNSTIGNGGGMVCNTSSPLLANCTFHSNAALYYGGGMWVINGSWPTLENTIIAFGDKGEAVHCEASAPTLTCCDVYGNAGGDWVGNIADQYGVNGNISEDPRFCDPDDDLRLWNYSPCNQETCGLIGAWPVGCWEPQVEKERAEKSATTTSILLGNTPNPFGSSTRITYRLADGSRVQRVELGVYDIRGRLIRRLVDTCQPAGFYSVAWDATNNRHQPVQAGLYFYRLTVSGRWQTGRTVLLR